MTSGFTKKSYRAEREFGLIVGGAFLLLGAWWLYRGKFSTLSHLALPVGALLVLFALIYPRALKFPNKAWMAMAEVMGSISSRIILTVVFFVIVTPIGFVKRLLGWDPLNQRAGSADSYWRPYSERQKNPRHYEKMF